MLESNHLSGDVTPELPGDSAPAKTYYLCFAHYSMLHIQSGVEILEIQCHSASKCSCRVSQIFTACLRNAIQYDELLIQWNIMSRQYISKTMYKLLIKCHVLCFVLFLFVNVVAG